MDVIVYLIVLALTGLAVGALGRLAIPGKDPMSIGLTILESSNPNFSQIRLRGCRAAGRRMAATRNRIAIVPVHGQRRPECHAFNNVNAANAA